MGSNFFEIAWFRYSYCTHLFVFVSTHVTGQRVGYSARVVIRIGSSSESRSRWRARGWSSHGVFEGYWYPHPQFSPPFPPVPSIPPPPLMLPVLFSVSQPSNLWIMILRSTLKEHLVAHLRSRPGRKDPETQRIAKEFHPAEVKYLSSRHDPLAEGLGSTPGPSIIAFSGGPYSRHLCVCSGKVLLLPGEYKQRPVVLW